MKDLNFFSSYNKKKDKALNREKAFHVVLSILILCILFYGLLNYFNTKKLNNDVSILINQLEEKNKTKIVKDLKQKESEIAKFKESIAKLNALDDYVTSKDIINDFLLDDIESNLPPKVFINSMDLKHDAIKIFAKSQDKDSIAQFQHNLKELGIFEEIFIPQIMQYDNYLDFSMDIRLKEEKADGAKAMEQ